VSASKETTDDDHLVALDLGRVWMHFPPTEGNPKSAGTWTFHPSKENDPASGVDFTTGLGYFPPRMLQCVMPGDDDDGSTVSSSQEYSVGKSSNTSGSASGGEPQGSDAC
jgi:hypothetical protein